MTTGYLQTLGTESSDAELFTALADADEDEREYLQDLLVRRYDGLVRWIASRYANKAVELDELRQVGYVGLVLAIRRFDPDRGCDFTSFAKPTVQGEIRRYFRDKRRWIRLPRRLQETKAALRGATETLTHNLGRSPTVAELAEHLAVDAELVLDAMTADDVFAPASLDTSLGSDRDGSYTIADRYGSVDERYELFDNCRSLGPLIAALSMRERRVIEMRFVHGNTQAEIGAEIGVSQMQVSRILSKTLASLRTQMEKD